MKVIFVGAGPGDPELLTRKAERLLRNCKFCVYAGSLINPDVLELLPSCAERFDSANLSLGEIIDLCVRAKERELDVVRLHSGDPSIYGAISEQMDALDAVGISYEIVPGVSSFQAAAAALEVELTAPEISQTIILSRISGRTIVPREQDLERLAATQATICLFLSIHKITEIAEIASRFYGPACPAAVVFRASWPEQRIIRGTLADIARKIEDAGVERTAQIIIGRALARKSAPSKLYDASFTHGYRLGMATETGAGKMAAEIDSQVDGKTAK